MTAISQVSQTETTFDRALSLRIDAIIKALDTVTAWPESTAKRMCMDVLQARRRELEKAMPV